jgi:hypothetical protein
VWEVNPVNAGHVRTAAPTLLERTGNGRGLTGVSSEIAVSGQCPSGQTARRCSPRLSERLLRMITSFFIHYRVGKLKQALALACAGFKSAHRALYDRVDASKRLTTALGGC